jgi:hypothetical protein
MGDGDHTFEGKRGEKRIFEEEVCEGKLNGTWFQEKYRDTKQSSQ